ncbi:hypothetical protein Lser_V15G19445 [Lactuca serriola]
MILRSHAFLAFLVNSLKIASFTLQTQKDDLHKVSNDPTSHSKQSMGYQQQHQHGHGPSVVVGTFKKCFCCSWLRWNSNAGSGGEAVDLQQHISERLSRIPDLNEIRSSNGQQPQQNDDGSERGGSTFTLPSDVSMESLQLPILGLLMANDNGSTTKYIRRHQLIKVLLIVVRDFKTETGYPAYTMGIVNLLLECIELSYRPEAGDIRLREDVRNAHGYQYLVQFFINYVVILHSILSLLAAFVNKVSPIPKWSKIKLLITWYVVEVDVKVKEPGKDNVHNNTCNTSMFQM